LVLEGFEKAADEMPDTVIFFDPTAVTLPEANSMLLAPGRPWPAPLPGKLPPPWGNRPACVPPGAPRFPPMPVQLPDEEEAVMDTVFAVMAPPLDLVPVAVTQSPLATEETDTVAIWLNVVEEVHDTVVWPVCAFWTSIDVPEIAATEPEVGRAVAAPAVAATERIPTAPETATETATRGHRQWRRRMVVVRFTVVSSLSSCTCAVLPVGDASEVERGHSVRRASIGAMRAARLAG
jgi:hypothetical protein